MPTIIGYLAFALGAFLSLLNFYLSFVRVPLRRALGRPSRFVSGFPLVGSLLLVASAVLLWRARWLAFTALAVAALDTGGLHWFLGVLLWGVISGRSGGGDAEQGDVADPPAAGR
jgi:hypothetical protein